LILLPALTVLLNFQRSTLIINGTTSAISVATALELTAIIVMLLVCVVILNLPGVVAAALAYMVGRTLSNIYLIPKQLIAVKAWRQG
jgi:hypothetical protein